jgi:CRISPR-associated protein Cas1
LSLQPTSTNDLIPVRALNQVTYCPRLYYLQYVDAVMPVNEHVAAGLHDHRAVDDPDLAERPRGCGQTQTTTTRSVELASETLGIIGKLDQVEERAGTVYPVETKHGSAPTDAAGEPTVWDNDAVQLCAQAMLLEQARGQPVPVAVQYYAGSRQRIELPITETLRRRTLDTIQRCRQLATSPTPPDPLPAEQRHRCFGCSLAPVCLPEETLYHLQHPDPADHPAPAPGLTRVIPDCDEGTVLYLQEPGSHVGKSSEHLIVRKDGQQIARVPIHQIRQVCVFGNVQVTTQALHTLVEHDIPVVYLTGYGRFIAALNPPPSKNVALREAQYQRFNEPALALTLSREIIRSKLTNQRALLMRSLRQADEPGSQEPAARALAQLIERIDHADSVSAILGLEGQGAALYFAEFGRFLRQPPIGPAFEFTARNRRPPRDPVNALLSFAYALLSKDCFAALCTVGFDPYKGFFHQNRHGRPALALDLMEEFRPLIADSVVLSLINNAMLTRDDFMIWRDRCQLSESGRKKFFARYEQRKSTEITHPIYGYKMTYARMLEVQARMLAAYIRGSIPEYVGLKVR